MKYQVNQAGFYGDFGGAFIPPTLQPIVAELQAMYIEIMERTNLSGRIPKAISRLCRSTYAFVLRRKTFSAIQYEGVFKTRGFMPYRSA
ncbi:tryptophan synthase beta subunit [Myroides gitamensis]|nr:tryptophan synthase beta subunit [Myroides gitamensis]